MSRAMNSGNENQLGIPYRAIEVSLVVLRPLAVGAAAVALGVSGLMARSEGSLAGGTIFDIDSLLSDDSVESDDSLLAA